MGDSPAPPVGINYQRGRFAVRDYPPLSLTGGSSPIDERRGGNATLDHAAPTYDENPVDSGTAYEPTEPPSLPPRMTLYAQPPQFVFRPVYMPAPSPVVVATPYDPGSGNKDSEPQTSHGGMLSFAGVLQGLDKIRAAHVQHQKTLRDLIIFHRPGESVINSDEIPSVVDRIHELVKALEYKNQQLAEQNRLLRLKCKERNIEVPDMGYSEAAADDYV